MSHHHAYKQSWLYTASSNSVLVIKFCCPTSDKYPFHQTVHCRIFSSYFSFWKYLFFFLHKWLILHYNKFCCQPNRRYMSRHLPHLSSLCLPIHNYSSHIFWSNRSSHHPPLPSFFLVPCKMHPLYLHMITWLNHGQVHSCVLYIYISLSCRMFSFVHLAVIPCTI